MTTSGGEPLPARIALDTSAYSYLRRGHPLAIEAVARAEIVYVCATVLGELEGGFRAGDRYAENKRALAEFLDEPYVETTDTTGDVARRYGEIFAALKAAGTPIPTNDIWIAAGTLDAGAHLLTFDEDFSCIQALADTVLRP